MYGYREQRGVVVNEADACMPFALSFMVPSSGFQVRIMAPLPEDFRAVLRALRR